MGHYKSNVRDLEFNLFEVLDLEKVLATGEFGDLDAQSVREMLAEVFARYGRPIFVAETGCEGEGRPDWLSYVAAEVRAAIRLGVPVEGICLYPVLNHPGWDDDRDCPNGLLEHTRNAAGRVPYPPLAAAIRREQALTAPLLGSR